MNKITRILIMAATCIGAGYIAGMATQSGVNEWFPTLEKPVFNPPSWVFAPVWSVLYLMMGVAAGLVWNRIERQPNEVKTALTFFAIQLVLNIAWSFLFFGLRNPLLAMVEIVVLLLLIYETYLKFRPIDRIAGWLFIPYLAWVAFATFLNASLWWLNR